MVAERQVQYSKGTYKVLFSKQNGAIHYFIINMNTGRQSKLSSVWELIKGIENDLSANKFPQSSIQYRSWGSSMEQKPGLGKVVALESVKNAELPETCSPTFIIQVLYRQNATWQGTIQWLEGRQTRLYRSVNELLMLMDEAVEATIAGQVNTTV